MAFIRTVAEDEAQGETAEIYTQAQATYGYVPNMTKIFSHRPEVMKAWTALAGVVRSNMELRRYELATLAAAKALTSSYCMLAHGSLMLREICSVDALKAIVVQADDAPISPAEQAIMRFAVQIARDATSVTADDIDELRGLGLSDAEIFDVASAAAIRCFFSKMLDALGALPDRAYAEIEPELRESLMVGRPIEG